MKYLLILLLIPMISFITYANETVVITDENGETKTCKVTESGTIVCL